MDASTIVMVLQEWYNDMSKKTVSPATFLSLIDETTDMRLLLEGVTKTVQGDSSHGLCMEFYRFAAVKAPQILQEFAQTLPLTERNAYRLHTLMREHCPQNISGYFTEAADTYYQANWDKALTMALGKYTNGVMYLQCSNEASNFLDKIRSEHPGLSAHSSLFRNMEFAEDKKDEFIASLYTLKRDVILTGDAHSKDLATHFIQLSGAYAIGLLNAEGKKHPKKINQMLKRIEGYTLKYTFSLNENGHFQVAREIDVKWKAYTKKTVKEEFKAFAESDLLPVMFNEFPHENLIKDAVTPAKIVSGKDIIANILSL